MYLLYGILYARTWLFFSPLLFIRANYSFYEFINRRDLVVIRSNILWFGEMVYEVDEMNYELHVYGIKFLCYLHKGYILHFQLFNVTVCVYILYTYECMLKISILFYSVLQISVAFNSLKKINKKKSVIENVPIFLILPSSN